MRRLSEPARHRLWVSTVVLLLIAAYVIRQWPERGFWYDETVNAYFAEQSWAAIWEWCTEIDNQMPIHFGMLKLWGNVAGTGEFALRFSSVVFALLAAAGVIALGRRVGRAATAGWLAALALTLTQSFLYAAFEVRPYALLLALAAWATVFLWALWKRYVVQDHPLDRTYITWLVAYWMLVLGLLYTHYTAFTALVSHGVLIGYALYSKRTRHGPIVAANLAIGLLIGYIPWLVALAGRDVRAGTSFSDHIPPGQALSTYLTFFTHGQRFVPDGSPPYEWVLAAVVLGSLILWITIGRRMEWPQRVDSTPISSLLLVCSMVLLPLAGLMAMVYGVQAKLSGRHGWVMWLGAALILGSGLGALGRYRWMRWPVWLGALLIVWLPSTADLQPIYNSYLREAFAYINDHAEPGDVLLMRDGTLFTAAEYYDVVIPWVGLPAEKITNVKRHLFFDEALEAVTALVERYGARRVWVLAWQGDIMDPQNIPAGLLEYVGDPEALEDAFGFGDVTLTRYSLHDEPDIWSNRVRSLNSTVQVPPDGPVYIGGYVLAHESVARGDIIQLHTWWLRGGVMVPDLRVSIRLYGLDGTIYSQVDGPPVTDALPQDQWPPETPVLGRFVWQVPMHVPVGPVELRMVVYDMDGTFEPFDVPVATVNISE